MQPRGAVAKKLGKAPRIIVDMGAPRKPLFATPSGARVPALNARAGPMMPPKWPREVKPTAFEAALNSAILMHVAEANGLPVFEIGADFYKYFHQYFTRMSTAVYDGAILPLLEVVDDARCPDLFLVVGAHTKP